LIGYLMGGSRWLKIMCGHQSQIQIQSDSARGKEKFFRGDKGGKREREERKGREKERGKG